MILNRFLFLVIAEEVCSSALLYHKFLFESQAA
jgi:hypothetical protein